jgi:hypothetical protein
VGKVHECRRENTHHKYTKKDKYNFRMSQINDERNKVMMNSKLKAPGFIVSGCGWNVVQGGVKPS